MTKRAPFYCFRVKGLMPVSRFVAQRSSTGLQEQVLQLWSPEAHPSSLVFITSFRPELVSKLPPLASAIRAFVPYISCQVPFSLFNSPFSVVPRRKADRPPHFLGERGTGFIIFSFNCFITENFKYFQKQRDSCNEVLCTYNLNSTMSNPCVISCQILFATSTCPYWIILKDILNIIFYL